MTAPANWDDVADLARRAQRDPLAEPQRGATDSELRDLEARLSQPLPPQLVEWLLIVNGDTIGEGGVFGARPDKPTLDIGKRRALHDDWAGRGWIPVASDGTGNYYVLRNDGSIGLVEPMADPAQVQRLVAASLADFLLWYLERP